MTVEIPAAKVNILDYDATTGDMGITIPYDYRDDVEALLVRMGVKRITQLYVKLALPRKPRTTGKRSQNRRIHGHATQIANFVGESKSKIISDAVDLAMGMYPEFSTYEDYRGVVCPTAEPEWSTVEAHYVCEALINIASTIGCPLTEYPIPKGQDDDE